jgi:hypothetical protein
MSTKTWKHDWVWCKGVNVKGQPCGNMVPQGFSYCYAHRNKRNKRNKRS